MEVVGKVMGISEKKAYFGSQPLLMRRLGGVHQRLGEVRQRFRTKLET
jgi:hypothetical protein